MGVLTMACPLAVVDRVLNCNPRFEDIWVQMTYYDPKERKWLLRDFNASAQIPLFEQSIREVVNPPAE